MPAHLKRSLSSTKRQASPPPVKRQKASSDPADTPVRSDTIRIFSWNVNGIGPLLQKQIAFDVKAGATYPIRTFLKRHQWPHLLCLQEVKISPQDEVTQRRLHLASNAGKLPEEPTYTTHFSLPRDKYNATGFGGKVHGVATLVRDDVSTEGEPSRFVTSRPDWDLEGRVLIHEFPLHHLVVVNGYWVNGTSNPYRNPETGDEEGTRHDHKLRFHQHMLELSKSITAEDKHVILIGDMNVAPARIDGHPNLRTSPIQHVKNRADFNAKFLTGETGLQGVDIFRGLHGQKKKFTYHPRGIGWGNSCDRVDLIVTDPRLWASGAVVATDICDNPKERGHSDHVPLWVEVGIRKLGSA